MPKTAREPRAPRPGHDRQRLPALNAGARRVPAPLPGQHPRPLIPTLVEPIVGRVRVGHRPSSRRGDDRRREPGASGTSPNCPHRAATGRSAGSPPPASASAARASDTRPDTPIGCRAVRAGPTAPRRAGAGCRTRHGPDTARAASWPDRIARPAMARRPETRPGHASRGRRFQTAARRCRRHHTASAAALTLWTTTAHWSLQVSHGARARMSITSSARRSRFCAVVLSAWAR